MYSIGGWITMPGSCSSGFRSRPSGAAGNRRSNGFGRRQQEQQEAERQPAHHGEDAGDEDVGQVPAELRDRRGPERQHQQPQQDRPLVAAPDRRDAVVQRQQAVRVRRDVQHREVVRRERHGEADERERDQREHDPRGRPRERHPVAAAARGAGHRQRAADERHAEREPEGEVSEFGGHRSGLIVGSSFVECTETGEPGKENRVPAFAGMTVPLR